jgi:hypothetical protein
MGERQKGRRLKEKEIRKGEEYSKCMHGRGEERKRARREGDKVRGRLASVFMGEQKKRRRLEEKEIRKGED